MLHLNADVNSISFYAITSACNSQVLRSSYLNFKLKQHSLNLNFFLDFFSAQSEMFCSSSLK